METNHIFSLQRFVLLCKQSLIINKKLIGITLAGFVGTLVFILVFFQSMGDFKRWESQSASVMFIFLFFSWGIIYASRSFPAFRSKEKSMTFLMLPATASEKFVFEFLTRIVLYLLLMPLLFWVVVNLEGTVVHQFVPEFTNYKFSFGVSELTREIPVEIRGRIQYLIVQGVLFVFIALFAGASYFSKSPLLKTLFAFSVIMAGYAFLSYLLFKGLNIRNFNPGRNIFFMDKNNAFTFSATFMTLINLSLLAIAWFRLKEKEA